MPSVSPTRVIVGACVLAFGASFLNTGFVLTMGTSVSHMTGDIAKIGAALPSLGSADGVLIGSVTLATLAFIVGATISGFVLHHPTIELSMPYGRVLFLIGASLVAAHFIHWRFPIAAMAIASTVCGAQNALASRYRGLVLRTTHLTGLFTDLGIHLGMKLRGHRIEPWKLLVPLSIALSFLAGALISSLFIVAGYEYWILYSALGYFFGGLVWGIASRTTTLEQGGDHEPPLARELES